MRYYRKKKGIKTLTALLLFFVCLTISWASGLFLFASVIPKASQTINASKTDAIVVLTGGSGRLEKALELLKKGESNILFVSGVYRGLDVRRLLKAMREEGVGIENRIRIGNATDTQENANESSEWAVNERITSIRLVTAAYHMPRSLMEFKFALPDNIKIIPQPIFPIHVKQEEWWMWPGTAVLIIGEYNKYLIGWVQKHLYRLMSEYYIAN